MCKHTELLLDDLEDLLEIELFRDTLHGGQGFAPITLCNNSSAPEKVVKERLVRYTSRRRRERRESGAMAGYGLKKRTLDANMNIFLGLNSLSRVLVGFGEGV